MLSLKILSPSSLLFEGEVESVSLPGSKGEFTMLHNHAPIVSSLAKGKVSYKKEGREHSYEISAGLMEAHDNTIKVCIESVI